MKTKVCKVCKKRKRIKLFPISKGYVEHQCRACKYSNTKLWRINNPSKIVKSKMEWSKNNPEKIKASKHRYRLRHPKRVRQQVRAAYKKYSDKYQKNRWRKWLWKKYKITESEYNQILNQQKGNCAICKNQQRCGKRKQLYIDHNHKSGKFRALVCFKCNVLLGMVDDSIKILKSAIKYLKKHTK